MLNAIFNALIPIVYTALIGHTLFRILKCGVIGVGKRGKEIYKKEQPVCYWLMVVGLAAGFIIGLCWLIIIIRYDFLLAKWPKPPN